MPPSEKAKNAKFIQCLHLIISFLLQYVAYPEQRKNTKILLEQHKFIKNSELSESCKVSAASVACKLSFPACTKDEKKIVSFINKEECHEKLEWYVVVMLVPLIILLIFTLQCCIRYIVSERESDL